MATQKSGNTAGLFKLAKSKGQYKGKCFLQKNRLVIDIKEFTTTCKDGLTEFPQDLQLRNTA